jgi:hypothetical protein
MVSRVGLGRLAPERNPRCGLWPTGVRDVPSIVGSQSAQRTSVTPQECPDPDFNPGPPPASPPPTGPHPSSIRRDTTRHAPRLRTPAQRGNDAGKQNRQADETSSLPGELVEVTGFAHASVIRPSRAFQPITRCRRRQVRQLLCRQPTSRARASRPLAGRRLRHAPNTRAYVTSPQRMA